MFKNKTLLITGGTGSFGQECTRYLLKNYSLKKLIIFSRDENKQYHMQKEFRQKNVRFFIGDVRDKSRLEMALKGVDYVIHAAALKHVPTAEYNPIECIRTNIIGAENLINSAIECKVKKVLALSTDKATNPINLYGATKLCSEKLFIAANHLSGSAKTKFSIVRYGNVINSRGSVVPLFKELIGQGKKEIPITDTKMTRFFISIKNSVKFVIKSLNLMEKGEIYIPKMPSFKIIDLARSIGPKIKIKKIGIRPGEKIHELLCSSSEAKYAQEYKEHYVIYPNIFSKLKKIRPGKKIKPGFYYSSDTNKEFLNLKQISKYINKN